MVMLPNTDEQPMVELLTEDEMSEAVEAAIASTGFSFDELRKQAQEGRFASEQARRVWGVVEVIVRST